MTDFASAVTYAERHLLNFIYNAPSKVVPASNIRRSLGYTKKGLHLVVNRMEDRHLINRVNRNSWTITFLGMQALGVVA